MSEKKQEFLEHLKKIREEKQENIDESAMAYSAIYGSYQLKKEAAEKTNENKENER